MSDPENNLLLTEQQKQKLVVINELVQKRNESKLKAIKDYKDAQAKILQKSVKQSKKFNFEYPCLKEDCDKGYTYFNTRKRHIIQKHKALAFELEYISFYCLICEDYGTNLKPLFLSHQEGCLEKHLAIFKFQGLKVEEAKLTAEQELLYQKAKKFNS